MDVSDLRHGSNISFRYKVASPIVHRRRALKSVSYLWSLSTSTGWVKFNNTAASIAGLTKFAETCYRYSILAFLLQIVFAKIREIALHRIFLDALQLRGCMHECMHAIRREIVCGSCPDSCVTHNHCGYKTFESRTRKLAFIQHERDSLINSLLPNWSNLPFIESTETSLNHKCKITVV